MANLVTAYLLWFFFGILGVHHFYLKRDRHAFVWWATLGGLLGMGWIRDLWNLPRYVQEANEDEDGYIRQEEDEDGYIDENDGAVNESRDGANQSLKIGGARLGGMLAMGYLLGYLMMFIFPQDLYKQGNKNLVRGFFLVLPPTAVAVGVHLVANIGRHHVSRMTCLLGSGLGVIWQSHDPTNIGWSCLLSVGLVYFRGCKRKSSRRHRSKCRRFSVLFLCGTVYLSMWGSALYFNATVTTSKGEEIPLRDAVNNFFTSPAWAETRESLYLIWQHIKVNGFRNMFEHIVQTMDHQGEASAYRVLGLREHSSQKAIKARYRELAKEWHPDKQKDPAKKEEAQTRFMQIQKAYETLSNIEARRSQKNQRQSANDEL